MAPSVQGTLSSAHETGGERNMAFTGGDHGGALVLLLFVPERVALASHTGRIQGL